MITYCLVHSFLFHVIIFYQLQLCDALCRPVLGSTIVVSCNCVMLCAGQSWAAPQWYAQQYSTGPCSCTGPAGRMIPPIGKDAPDTRHLQLVHPLS